MSMNIIRKAFVRKLADSYLAVRNLATNVYLQQVQGIEQTQKSVRIHFKNEKQCNYHYIWLRDHCRCSSCFNHLTNQRTIDTFEIPLNIAPQEIANKNGDLQVTWKDGHRSEYTSKWLQENHYCQSYSPFLIDNINPLFWGSEIKNSMPPCVAYNEYLDNDQKLLTVLETMEKYGFAIVSETPPNLEALRNVGERIGPIRKNLYGDVWEVTNQEEGDLDHLDMSYMNVALNAHTDGTYFIDSPGIQVFHCFKHTGSGGENLLVDGIGAAEQLRKSNPEAFNFLTTALVPAQYYEPNTHAKVLGPIIKMDPISEQVYQVRVNGEDRDILSCLSFDDVERFYEAIHYFTAILRKKENEFWLKLTPGNCLLVNNWRVLHGRASFTGTRTMGGFYMNKDDYLSKIRVLQSHGK